MGLQLHAQGFQAVELGLQARGAKVLGGGVDQIGDLPLYGLERLTLRTLGLPRVRRGTLLRIVNLCST